MINPTAKSQPSTPRSSGTNADQPVDLSVKALGMAVLANAGHQAQRLSICVIRIGISYAGKLAVKVCHVGLFVLVQAGRLVWLLAVKVAAFVGRMAIFVGTKAYSGTKRGYTYCAPKLLSAAEYSLEKAKRVAVWTYEKSGPYGAACLDFTRRHYVKAKAQVAPLYARAHIYYLEYRYEARKILSCSANRSGYVFNLINRQEATSLGRLEAGNQQALIYRNPSWSVYAYRTPDDATLHCFSSFSDMQDKLNVATEGYTKYFPYTERRA